MKNLVITTVYRMYVLYFRTVWILVDELNVLTKPKIYCIYRYTFVDYVHTFYFLTLLVVLYHYTPHG
jgi:hypothetical protein